MQIQYKRKTSRPSKSCNKIDVFLSLFILHCRWLCWPVTFYTPACGKVLKWRVEVLPFLQRFFIAIYNFVHWQTISFNYCKLVFINSLVFIFAYFPYCWSLKSAILLFCFVQNVRTVFLINCYFLIDDRLLGANFGWMACFKSTWGHTLNPKRELYLFLKLQSMFDAVFSQE